MEAADETNITDIELLPNGRICVFGTSVEVLELLDGLQAGLDEKLRRRLIAGREHSNTSPVSESKSKGQLDAGATR